jgi:3-oxoacyl-[acyl-carrier protein] reductase
MTCPRDGVAADRVAIVTGGSRGTGRATIDRLASCGYAVVVNYLHDQRAAEATVDAVLALRGAAVAVRADAADDLDVQRLFVEAIAVFGGVDVVVHAVAARIDTRATLIVDREAARRVRNGGAIVNLLSSAHGVDADARAASDVLTRALAVELGARDITVNAVSLAAGGPCLPELIADMVVYLLRDEGRGLSGRVIRIDAGDRPGPAHR